MILDQHLYIKRKNKTNCKPTTLQDEEIGYWCKDYEVDSLIIEATGDYNKIDNYCLTKEMCKYIIGELKVFKKIYKLKLKETKLILKRQTNVEDIEFYYKYLDDCKWDYKNMCNSIKTFKRGLKYFKYKDFNGMYYCRSN